MKRMKKIVALGLATAMLLGMSLTASASYPIGRYCLNPSCGSVQLYSEMGGYYCPICKRHYSDSDFL